MVNARTTERGYVNHNNQVNLGRTDPRRPGTDHLQYVYVMRCGDCGETYGANGSAIFERRCPVPVADCVHGGGMPGLGITDEEQNWPNP